jgi:metal-responsive CopG/Arc/MetJ family transcriptional regulator
MAQTEKTNGTVRLSRDAIKAVDKWARRNHVTRSEAVRRLLKSALGASRAATKLKLIRR